MLIIGLTGGIATGKTTVSKLFRRHGIPVISADALVHDLLRHGGKAVDKVAKLFPAAHTKGAIDRRILAELTFGKKEQLKALESVLHPLVRRERKTRLRALAAMHTPFVVLEIPLLFETGAARLCDLVVTTSAPLHVQMRRAMQRPDMTKEKLAHILKQQTTDAHKRKNSGFIVHTGRGRHQSQREVQRIIHHLRTLPAKRWRPGYGR